MASTLVNVALSSIRPPHASYYGEINDTNPVIHAANKEIKEVLAYFAKKAAGLTKSDEACSRGSNWLFDILNKYEPRLPLDLYYTKLIEVGDNLQELGVNFVASHLCYRRYLITRFNEVPMKHVDDAPSYRKAFFNDELKTEDHILTAKALLGFYMCEYKNIHETDPFLLSNDSVSKCQNLLRGIRTFMQCLMVHESFFWLVYNCTIIMYKICRMLMNAGNSLKAVDFILWAAMCMESIVPLLGVRYLSWRVTLYSAVCLAYYDIHSGHHAETFARRSLSKLQELSELERLSCSTQTVETQCIFRQATAKMASMIFKRSVYESRRKLKGLLRPKVRSNLKDAAQSSWPRTITERLLNDMFEGSAAQFLGILEALSSSHRRTLRNAPSSSETEMLEVTSELFFAGKEIVAGGGGNKGQVASGADHSVLAGVQHEMSLIDLAAAGLDGVTLSSVVRFIKLAFCYEMWQVFNTMLDCALIYIKKSGDDSVKDSKGEHSGTELCLAILLVMERVAREHTMRKPQFTTSGSVLPSAVDEGLDHFPPLTQASTHSVQINDDLVNLAETILYSIGEPSLFLPQGLDGDILIDRDMILDATLLLWQKYKHAVGRAASTSKRDAATTLLRTGDPGKWLHVLTVVHSALSWCAVGSVDPALMAEVCLRLSMSLEAAATSDSFGSRLSDDGDNGSRLSVYSTTQLSPNSQLVKAISVLEEGLKAISIGRANMTSNDARSVADILWMNKNEEFAELKISSSDAFIRDLHVEMLVVLHRISLKLMDRSTARKHSVEGVRASASRTVPHTAESVVLSEENIKEKVGGSLLSRAIHLMQKADLCTPGDRIAEKLLEKAVSAIENAQEEEKRIFEDSWLRLNNPYIQDNTGDIPPPPILLSRCDTSMRFKPAPFTPDSGEVAWYRIFARLAAGPNVKVRVNDYFLPGAGDEVPAGDDCVLRIDGLTPNQRYVFAVAAYTSDGKMIGGSIGKTSKSIVACHPLSCLAVWGHLAHISYKLGCLKVSKRACSVLWDIFVTTPSEPPSATWPVTNRRDFSLVLYHLNRAVALESSPVLLRHALTAVFVAVETAVSEQELFCDKVCEKGPLLESQIARLRECERMLVAMEIAGWLNDPSSVLQAVVQTYGLIAPIIQAEITTLPVLQVATRCHSALQEIKSLLKQKRSNVATDSLMHMIAVLTNYISTFAKIRAKTQLALATIDIGKQLLRGDHHPLPSSRKGSLDHSAKRTRARKPGSDAGDRSTSGNTELVALEERLADLAREIKAPDELTGIEEPNTVISRLSKMKPIVGFREVSKFRRRTRFLEFFVIVLRKALKMQLVELAIEWSQDVLAFLHRRNEVLVVNRAVVSKQPGGLTVQGEESRKYAAAVAEFAQQPKRRMKKDSSARLRARDKHKGFSIRMKRSGIVSEEQEEAERKALQTLSVHLTKLYRNHMKKRRLRKVILDELVPRSEFNLLNALLHFQVFQEKLRERSLLRGYKTPTYGAIEFLDQDWWSLCNGGSVIVGWDDGFRQTTSDQKDEIKEEPKKALEKAAYLAVASVLVAENKPPLSPFLDDGGGRADTPRGNRAVSAATSTMSHQTTNQEMWNALQPESFMHPIKVAMICFRRAMVLAYRGKHWTLLQNCVSSFYSCVLAAHQMACDGSEPAFTLRDLRDVVSLPMTMAADFLMDMLIRLDEGGSHGDWLYQSFIGDEKGKKGGFSLKFEKYFDDATTLNLLLIKKVIFHAVQLLHYETRYEKLVDVCLRFSEISHDRFSDVITPLVVHAQAKIEARVLANGGESHPQQHFVVAARNLGKTTVDNKDYLRYRLKVSGGEKITDMGVGGFIDPESHDVYGGGKRALALSCVPFDPTHSMEKLRMTCSKSQYTSRALQHSRRLLAIYLASQHCGGNTPTLKSRKQSVRTDSIAGSAVEFSTKADERQHPTPPDVANLDFTSANTLEILASPQISTALESYTRTIELLEAHGQTDLVSQASNELGNLYFHLENNKAAKKWWKHSLDQILKTKNSLLEWKKLIKDEDNIPEELLSICGVWGCLLGISVVCKIGEFIASDIALKSECALLASKLVKAVFRSSLPHPNADVDYALYEIIPTCVQSSILSQNKGRITITTGDSQANSLMNGIDLFSDRFRCDLQTLVSSLQWLCDYLVGTKHNLAALPALSLYQYLASFVCRDLQRSIHCRCLKVSALTELRKFKEASEEILNLLFGARLPHTGDVGYAPSDPIPVTTMFDTTKSIDDSDNLKVMEVVASKRLSQPLANAYGPHLTCEVTLCQASLLIQLASCIACIPQKPTIQDLSFVSPESVEKRQSRNNFTASPIPANLRLKRRQSSIVDDARSTGSTYSATSTSKYVVNKLFTKRDRPMGLQLLKGMLLVVAENLASNITKTIVESSIDEQLPSEVWMQVRGYFLMSEIQQQRQLSTLSASRALSALNVLRDSSLFAEEAPSKPRKLRSAFRTNRNNEEQTNSRSSTAPEKKNEPYQAIEQTYRTRLNSRLWMDCRLRLCQALASQVKGLGKIEESLSDTAGLLDHSQAQLYCAEGLAEAESCNDVEMQALFLLQGALLDGVSSDEAKHMLEDATTSLDEQAELSSRAVIGLVESTVIMADIMLASGSISAQEGLQVYKSAQSVLLLKAMQEGETIVHSHLGDVLSCVEDDMKNIYSSDLLLLSQIKLRIAHSLAQTLVGMKVGSDHNTVAKILSQASELCSTSSICDPHLLAEIHVELGQIQKALLSIGDGDVKVILAGMEEFVTLSENDSSDLPTTRQAFLEMALIDLINIERKFSNISIPSVDPERSFSSPSIKAEGSQTDAGIRSFSLDVGVVSQPLELTQARSRITSALHAAYDAARHIQQRAVLPGDLKVTSLTFGSDDKQALPDFVVVDLSSDHTSVPTLIATDENTHDLLLSGIRVSATSLTWIHVFMYNVLLQRKSRLSTLVTSVSTSDSIEQESRGASGSEASSRQLAAPPTSVRTPLRSQDIHLRLASMHNYLMRHTAYSNTCGIPVAPKDKAYVVAQWYKSQSKRKVELLWCVSRKEGPIDCGRVAVGLREFNNVTSLAVSLQKRTDEFFGRASQPDTTQRRRIKPKQQSLDSQLEEDWKHVVSQVNGLLSAEDEPITQLPFPVNVATATSFVELFSLGCCFEASHPLFKWMSALVCPC